MKFFFDVCPCFQGLGCSQWRASAILNLEFINYTPVYVFLISHKWSSLRAIAKQPRLDFELLGCFAIARNDGLFSPSQAYKLLYLNALGIYSPQIYNLGEKSDLSTGWAITDLKKRSIDGYVSIF